MAKYSELLLDTNFVIEATKREVVEEAKGLVPGAGLVTLQAVVDELGGNALALEVLLAEGVEVKPIEGYADDEILAYAKKGGVAVATNDAALKKRLREKGIPVVFLTKSGCGLVGGIV